MRKINKNNSRAQEVVGPTKILAACYPSILKAYFTITFCERLY